MDSSQALSATTAGSREARENAGGWGVLLLAHGAPDKLEDIPAFLLKVRDGRPLPDAAVQEIVHRYKLIGGGSPLLSVTRRQAEALEQALDRARKLEALPPVRVSVGMRNWKPLIAEGVECLRDDGVKQLLAVCLAPHNSRTSVGLYRRHLDEAVKNLAPSIRVEFVASWHDQPELIAAFREKISEALDRAERAAGGPVPVIFTAHSVPTRTIVGGAQDDQSGQGDPYETQVNETARLVAETLSLDRWTLAFQSQGMTAEPWIGPTVESKIDELAAQGFRHVLIAPVGFVSDHVEILYDIDVAFRQYGKERGVTVWRSESLNDSPLFIRALYAIVARRIRE